LGFVKIKEITHWNTTFFESSFVIEVTTEKAYKFYYLDL
jgi:hypothetical protein